MKHSLLFAMADTEGLGTSSIAPHGTKMLMKYSRIIVTHYGGPDELRVVEEECPEPKEGEVRVRVQAAGVSLPDVIMREGIHPKRPGYRSTPGWDVVGVVDRLGDGVSGFELGQQVAALPIFARTWSCYSACHNVYWFRRHPGKTPPRLSALY